jgi:hypothetical protein
MHQQSVLHQTLSHRTNSVVSETHGDPNLALKLPTSFPT